MQEWWENTVVSDNMGDHQHTSLEHDEFITATDILNCGCYILAKTKESVKPSSTNSSDNRISETMVLCHFYKMENLN